MGSVYIETTVLSYLVARPSQDVIVAGHQQTTKDWWSDRRSLFRCYLSQVVIDEASAGDAAEAQKRLAAITDLFALDVTHDAQLLAQAIVASGSLPAQSASDALHAAISALHNIDYLNT